MLVGMAPAVGLAEPPAPLKAFEEARKSLVSGRVEWAVLPAGDPERALSFVNRYAANGDLIHEVRGDKDGWTVFNTVTGEGVHRFPQLYLVNSAGVWHHQETGLGCALWRREPQGSSPYDGEIRDVRAIGVYPTSSSLEYVRGLGSMWGPPGESVAAWSETEDAGLYIVEGRLASGPKMTWYIDAERGWNAERVEYDTDYGHWEAISSLREYGGVWFPEETSYYQDGKLTETIVVRSASFNRPDDPRRFTPADLGVEPGTQIAVQNDPSYIYDPAVHKDIKKYVDALPTWNGEETVAFGKWIEDVRAGRRDWGPRFKRAMERGFNESPYETPEQVAERKLALREMRLRYVLRRHVEMWERYVRQFIDRYRLDDEQQQKAWAVFLECRRRADAIIDRHRDRLTELVSESLAAREAGEREKAEKLAREAEELRAPVDRIFEEELKPRLDRIPTREQRRQAEADTGAPAAEPSTSPSASNKP